MPSLSPPHSVFGSPSDLESISNGLHSLLITDAPKLEQFPHITSPEVNGSSSVHLPFSHTDPVKTWKTKMPTSIRLFRGVQDSLEDPDEYIKDLEWAYAQDYQSAEPSNNPEAKQIFINKTYRILFRNHLEGKAVEWYSNLSATTRKDWNTLKASFFEYFKLVSRDSQTRLWEKKVELANLRQGNNKSIAQFLKRAEELADQIPVKSCSKG